jgi:hypothetical protein
VSPIEYVKSETTKILLTNVCSAKIQDIDKKGSFVNRFDIIVGTFGMHEETLKV